MPAWRKTWKGKGRKLNTYNTFNIKVYGDMNEKKKWGGKRKKGGKQMMKMMRFLELHDWIHEMDGMPFDVKMKAAKEKLGMMGMKGKKGMK